MRRRPTLRLLLGVAWTGALVAGLSLADRVLLPEEEPIGWIVAPDLASMPRAARRRGVPSYLPGELSWPPGQLFYRTRPSAGWWMAVEQQGQGPRLWIGSGALPAPEALGEAAGCLKDRCPAAWHLLSRQMPGGQPIHVLTTLGLKQATWVFRRLGRSSAAKAVPR